MAERRLICILLVEWILLNLTLQVTKHRWNCKDISAVPVAKGRIRPKGDRRVRRSFSPEYDN
jgi:hypothetical protein